MRQADLDNIRRFGEIDLMELSPGEVLQLYSPVSPRHETTYTLTPTHHKRLISDEEGYDPDKVTGFLMMAASEVPVNLTTLFTGFVIHRLVRRNEPFYYYLYDSKQRKYVEQFTGRITQAHLYAGARMHPLF